MTKAPAKLGKLKPTSNPPVTKVKALDAKPKSLEDLMAEIAKNTASQEPVDGPKPPSIVDVPAEAKQHMLNELAEKFSTTAEEVEKSLKVGDTVASIRSPDKEQRTLPKGTQLIPVLLKRDYWAHVYAQDQWPSEGDNRCKAGSTIRLPVDEARRLINSGSAERNDPLPGEK